MLFKYLYNSACFNTFSNTSNVFQSCWYVGMQCFVSIWHLVFEIPISKQARSNWKKYLNTESKTGI